MPFLRETVLEAHQIGPSELSWKVSDVGFPELILAMRMEEIPFPYSLSVFRCTNVQFVVLKNLPDCLLVYYYCAKITKNCPHSPVSILLCSLLKYT